MRLKEAQAIFQNDPRDVGDCINPRTIQSIQQSLAVEGYVFSEERIKYWLEIFNYRHKCQEKLWRK